MGSPDTVVTLWFASAAIPVQVLRAEPTPDRGFARKFLAQLGVRLSTEGSANTFGDFSSPTHIGDFDMNRSAPPGRAEFYIGGYAGLSLVQTVLPEPCLMSEVPAPLRELIAAADLYVTCRTPDDPDGLGGFAHWSGGTLKRAFTATRDKIYEDTGLPEPFEAPFWEGNVEATGIQLPFRPGEFAAAAEEHWLGFRVEREGIDIPVCAFALDGRPAPRAVPGDSRPASRTRNPQRPQRPQNVQNPLPPGYDDYAEGKESAVRSTSDLLKGATVSAVTGVGRGVVGGVRLLQTGAHRIGDEVRRRARNTGR
ncbi:DUF6928 family protein [Corynebacterium sp. AOP40-9SA-29]|uniref:DUF6928 family protein n=1 Tax=Corynebacterium sp. AOP40-9SA-29 TaxID=3457677 RepID=UPI004033A8CF